MKLIGVTLSLIVIGVCVAIVRLLMRSAVKSATLLPTPEEAKIHAQAAKERAELSAPAPPVETMTDAQLEAEANDRAPLAPPRK